MKIIKQNFSGYRLLLKACVQRTEILGSWLFPKGRTEMFRIMSEVSNLPASYFAWVIGDGLSLHTKAAISVYNPSPLIDEIY